MIADADPATTRGVPDEEPEEEEPDYEPDDEPTEPPKRPREEEEDADAPETDADGRRASAARGSGRRFMMTNGTSIAIGDRRPLYEVWRARGCCGDNESTGSAVNVSSLLANESLQSYLYGGRRLAIATVHTRAGPAREVNRC